MKILSAQAKSIYNLLLQEKKACTAEQIAERLGILSNAVYRSVDHLSDLGLVHKQNTHPIRYAAVPPEIALNWFLLAAAAQFKHEFGVKSGGQQKLRDTPSVTFIKHRPMLLGKTDHDARLAKRTINFLVSGLEVPDTTVMAYRRAIAKGVKVRVLVQRYETSRGKLEQWQAMGVEARKIRDLHIRLFVFDSKIVYFTSYDAEQKNRAFGIRFNYPPLAHLMDEVFESYWQVSQRLPDY